MYRNFTFPIQPSTLCTVSVIELIGFTENTSCIEINSISNFFQWWQVYNCALTCRIFKIVTICELFKYLMFLQALILVDNIIAFYKLSLHLNRISL